MAKCLLYLWQRVGRTRSAVTITCAYRRVFCVTATTTAATTQTNARVVSCSLSYFIPSFCDLCQNVF